MRDKVAQRERTEMIVGGARTFNEFVKEKALASNITPACVRSLPEIKEEWKQLKEKEKAEKKAEKTATKEAKKAEKKAEQQAKKATAKSTTAVAKEKTAIKKVAKKSAVDAENIKMVLVEKAHKKSQAEKPPAEPKSKGRPKKYATPEEARRAKIEATKALNKAKKASLPPKPPKEPKPQKQGKKQKEPEVTAEQIRRENEEHLRMMAKKRKAYDREMRRRGEVEQMGMEDEDATEKWHPLVHEIELKIYQAKTIKEIDEVLKLIKKAVNPKVYDTLDPVNVKSLDHSIDVYSKKKMAWIEHQREAEKNIAMFKNAKAKKRANLEEGEIYEGRGLNPDDLKEFKNYGKIQEHLSHHLNDLKEAIDPKDLRDYLHFTKEKARLKSKLVGGLVRMIGGELECSDSDSGSDSDSDMEGGGDFFGNIGKAFKASWDRPVQSKAERDVLDFTLNKAQPALLAPLNILAPPVGKIGDAQRQLLKSKYNV